MGGNNFPLGLSVLPNIFIYIHIHIAQKNTYLNYHFSPQILSFSHCWWNNSMGINHSKNINSEPNPEVHFMDNSPSQGSCIVELLKPEWLRVKKMTKNRKKKKQTLEEWLLASPSLNPDCINGGELFVSKHFFKRIHPSSSSMEECEAISSKARKRSFSLERLVMLDREADRSFSSMDISSIRKDPRSKSKKMVSFKLPDESDIIIFYSPKELSMENDQDCSM